MKGRDAIIGFVFLVILIAGALWLFKVKKQKAEMPPIATPNIVDKINQTFPHLTIPEGTERANLNDVTGGDKIGVATRTEIVANLPPLSRGETYDGWLENSGGQQVRLGSFTLSKSGWLLNYDSVKYPGYNKVIITKGKTHILEGTF